MDEFNGEFSAESVYDVMDTYRRWRDMSYVFLGLTYILNVVDANVDAHFVRFDVGRDLSLGIAPAVPLAYQGSLGVGLSLTWR